MTIELQIIGKLTMSYKTCPKTIRDVKSNIKICNNMIGLLEKRQEEINVGNAGKTNQGLPDNSEELVTIGELLLQWGENRNINLENLSFMREAENRTSL